MAGVSFSTTRQYSSPRIHLQCCNNQTTQVLAFFCSKRTWIKKLIFGMIRKGSDSIHWDIIQESSPRRRCHDIIIIGFVNTSFPQVLICLFLRKVSYRNKQLIFGMIRTGSDLIYLGDNRHHLRIVSSCHDIIIWFVSVSSLQVLACLFSSKSDLDKQNWYLGWFS